MEQGPCRNKGDVPLAMILGVPFARITAKEALERIDWMISTGNPHQIVTANVDFLVQAMHDPELHRVFLEAQLVLCDGTPLVWASRILRQPLPERVAGADLAPLLFSLAAQKGYRIFFLGGEPGVTAHAIENLRKIHPALCIAGHFSPPFADLQDMDHDNIRQRITDAHPDILLVSFGCPKAEKWIAMNYRSLGVPVSIGVGATVDFLAGKVRRAPFWMQRAGIEWVFRLIQEPRRLWRRYAQDLRHFSLEIARQCMLSYRGTRNPNEASCRIAVNEATWRKIEVPENGDVSLCRPGSINWDKMADRHCLLDLSRVKYLGGNGIAALFQLKRQLNSAKRDLLLINPSPAARTALNSQRLDTFFPIASNVTSAFKSIRDQAFGEATAVTGPGTNSLAWRGEITVCNAEKIEQKTDAQLKQSNQANSRINIDMSQVRFIDSAGILMINRLRRLSKQRGTALNFVRVSPAVRCALRLSHKEELLSGENE